MSHQTLDPQTIDFAGDPAVAQTSPESGAQASPESGAQASPESSASPRRLNAGAAEFIPRSSSPPFPASPSGMYFVPAAVGSVEFYGGSSGGFVEHDAVSGSGGGGGDVDLSVVGKDGLSDDLLHKITKQVEYYFSDANLATTEHLMKFISKDPEGFVPITVIAAFKKIKSLIHSTSHLAMALRTSSKLVVSADGKKVRRQQPFTEADVEKVQSRIVVAENLPEDHCYQNLMKVFSVVGSVKTIRTCYPQTPNGTTAASASGRSSKLDMLFGNRLHAFVEYETIEDAEKAITELNDESWRNGLKLRMLNKCLAQPKHGHGRGRKGHDGDMNGEEDVAVSNHPSEKHSEGHHQLPESLHEHMGEDSSNDKDGSTKRGGKGRGRGGRGRGRGQHPNNSRSGGHAVGTPPSSHPIHGDQPVIHKQPPGPRMPDGTKGFTLGRGKPATSTSSLV